MAVNSAFFNSKLTEEGTYDREYDAVVFASYFASFIGNGVFPNPSSGLQVMSNSGLSVNVRPGSAWINGYWMYNDDNFAINLAAASGELSRIDIIVVRWSLVDRSISLASKQGVPAISPSPPVLQRDAEYYELCLAEVTVPRSVISVTQTNIKDTRMNKSLCGIVHGVIEQLDTTTLGNQLQTFIDEYKTTYNADYGDFILFMNGLEAAANSSYVAFNTRMQSHRVTVDESTNEYLIWLQQYKPDILAETEELLDEMRDLLDGDAVADLQLQIDDIESQVSDTNPDTLIATINHNLNKYPEARLYKIDYAVGIGGLGNNAVGGSNMDTIPVKFSLSALNRIQVYVPSIYSSIRNVIQANSNTWYVYSNDSSVVSSFVIFLS